MDLILVLHRHHIIPVIPTETGQTERWKNMGKKGIPDLKKLKDFGKILEKAKAKGIKSKSSVFSLFRPDRTRFLFLRFFAGHTSFIMSIKSALIFILIMSYVFALRWASFKMSMMNQNKKLAHQPQTKLKRLILKFKQSPH